MSVNAYRYKGCGLDNVFLANGYTITKGPKGDEIVRIEDLKGLHRAIALHIVESAEPLSGKAFRFLRKELDMSQRQISTMLGNEEQTVSLWERGQGTVSQPADLLLRALIKETISGSAELKKLIDHFNRLDRDQRAIERSLEFSLAANDGWELLKRAG